jgi:hypothetical protein
MAVVLRPPFWVPRQSADDSWNAAPTDSPIIAFLTKQKIYGVGGQVPTKRWLPYYTYNVAESQWNAAPTDSPIIAFLTKQKIYGVGGQVPTKRWLPYYTENDPPPWQMPAELLNSGVIQQLSRITFPLFTPFLWRLHYTQNDPPPWQGTPVGPIDNLYSVTVNPRVPQFPDLYSEDAAWQGTPVGPIDTLYPAAPPASITGVIMAPLWAPRPPVEQPWLQAFVRDVALLNAAPTPFSPDLWKFDRTDETLWSGAPDPSGIMQILGRVPFAKLWRDDFDTGESQWNAAPDPSGIIQILGRLPFARLWRYDHNVAESLWNAAPDPSAIIQILATAGQPIQKVWRYDLDTGETQWQVLIERNAPLLAPTAQPFGIRQPPFYSEDAFWVGSPDPSGIIQILVAAGRPPTRVWRFGLDDPPQWQGVPVPRNTPLFLAKPFVGRQAYYSEDAFWVGAPDPSAILQILGAAGNPAHRLWRYDFDAAETFWQATIERNARLLTPTRNPFFLPFQTFNAALSYDIAAPGWQGKPTEGYGLYIAKLAGNPFHLPFQTFGAALSYDIAAPGWGGAPYPSFTIYTPGPPPVTGVSEWLIRARRRGRR